MLTTLAILLIRQYRKAGSRQEFFKWMSQSIGQHAAKAVRITMAFLFIVTLLKA